MNRTSFRLMGILLGLFAGTVVAMVSVSIRRARRGNETATADLGTPMLPTDHASINDAQPAPPDPGRRRQLQELRDVSAGEPNWTRSFELTERSGRTLRSEDLLGEPYVVCFFFSTCPGTCTRQSGEMRLLQSKFKGKPIKLVSISVDPEIDTPEVLRAYADRFNAAPDQWLFLTGPLEDIIRIGTEMFFLPGVELRGHPDRFCLVNAKGELVGSYNWKDTEELEQLVAHIEELLGQ